MAKRSLESGLGRGLGAILGDAALQDQQGLYQCTPSEEK